MKNIVVYHRADYDGLFSREVAKRFLRGDTRFIGWDYGDPTPQIPNDVNLYIIDLSVEGLMNHPRLVWIDHHASAIAKYPTSIKGYRIDGVAACRLACQWFFVHEANVASGRELKLPSKEEFLTRRVIEPIALTLAGEYDVWQHENSKGEDIVFQFGLDTEKELDWVTLLDLGANREYIQKLLVNGLAAKNCYAKRDTDIMRERSFVVEWEGLKFLALNTARSNSNTFESKDVIETGHDALMSFYFNGKNYGFSLYHSALRKDLDLSKIASKYGGGGHKGACGFRVDKLPF